MGLAAAVVVLAAVCNVLVRVAVAGTLVVTMASVRMVAVDLAAALATASSALAAACRPPPVPPPPVRPLQSRSPTPTAVTVD